MKLYVGITLIIVACITSPVLTQRGASQQQQQQQDQSQYCVTPENYYGTCVTLSYCPQIANVFQVTNSRQAQQYILLSQRACNTRSINGDPVVCCTRPQTNPQTTARPAPTTQANSFLFTEGPTSVTPSNPFLPAVNTPATQPPTETTTSRSPRTSSAIFFDNSYCRGPDTREGSCIPIKNCRSLVNELKLKPNDQTFARFLRASNQICMGVDTNVCCPGVNVKSSQSMTNRPAIKNSNEIPRRLPTAEEGCGFNRNSYKKIVGGEVSKRGAWPWIALIGYDDDLSASPFKCGGTLITARHVITAAHCLRRDLSFVRLGEHDLTTDSEAEHVDIPVVRTEKHPDYNPRNGRSDIAILYLARNVKFSEFIAPICLPVSRELRQRSYVGHTPFVVGWGKTMEGGTSSNVLQELQIPIFENQVCQDRYRRQNRLFTANQFDNAVLCAGVLSGGKDTCQGDSGGPLMIPEPYANNVRFYLIGVVSYGIGCARPDIPGVYTSTQYFMDWIVQKVANTP